MQEGTAMDSNSTNPTLSNKEVFKELWEIFGKLFTFLFALIVLKNAAAGGEFLTRNHTVMMAIILTILVYFLVLVLGTVLQLHITSFLPISLILVLGSFVSILALSLISLTSAWITLALWVFIFIVIAIYKLIPSAVIERIKKWIESSKPQFGVPERIKKWIESDKPQSTRLPV